MRRRFGVKKFKVGKWLKFLLFLVIIYYSFSFTYRLIVKKYFFKNKNEFIINIINGVENEKFSSRLDKYLQPENILKYTLNINFMEEKKEEVILVNKEQVEDIKSSVYIYSTHEKEAYSNKHFEVYNITPDVKTAGYILKDYLEDLGINVILEDGSVTKILRDNKWAYNRSYDASRFLIKDKIKQNKDLKLIIDLHRDSSSLKKTLLEYNDNDYARILFVIGAENKNYKTNLAIAKDLKSILEKEVPNITRGISEKSGPGVNGIYNQDLSNKAVLIELGGQYNEIEQINNSAKVLAKAIFKYLEE